MLCHRCVRLPESSVFRRFKRTWNKLHRLTWHLTTTQEHNHTREIVFGSAFNRLVAYGNRSLSWVNWLALSNLQLLRCQFDNGLVWKAAFRYSITNQHKKIRWSTIELLKLGGTAHRVVLRAWTSSVLVLRIAEGTANGQVSIHPCHSHYFLHVTASALNPRSFARKVWLMVRGEATVGSRPREDRTISPPQKHTAIANVAHSEVIIASRRAWRLNNDKRSCRSARLVGVEKLLV
mmetsp:Transcript_48789/g.116108  ORF Transcript_48789/g.116108 Transcript_48789/m.116108 type:complete len:235 (-) Transcript_48789:164-868(-)